VNPGRGDVYSAKNGSGQYWCGNNVGWVNCRICALRMARGDAHRAAHAVYRGTVVVIRTKSSHALTKAMKGGE
jgi:hypothetical protein